MITIDGGHGGGAVVRTVIGLAAATGTPVTVENIRENRSNPGLRHQHLAGITAVADVFDADLSGAELGSQTVQFTPHAVSREEVRIDIPTAGSVALALQPLQIALLGVDEAVEVTVDGGATVGKWAPTTDYLQQVTYPCMAQVGQNASVQVRRHGFYPEGGALADAAFSGAATSMIDLQERGSLQRIGGRSVASQHLRDADVAARQRKETRRVLANAYPSIELDIEERYVETRSPGSAVTLWAETEDAVLGAVSIGEKGKRSEIVGQEAANRLLAQLDAGAPVDRWLADQLIPVLAVVGGMVQVPEMTDHVESNLRVARQFADITVAGKTVTAE